MDGSCGETVGTYSWFSLDRPVSLRGTSVRIGTAEGHRLGTIEFVCRTEASHCRGSTTGGQGRIASWNLRGPLTPGRQSADDGRSSRRSLSRTRQSVPAAGSSRRSSRSLVLHQAECAGSRFFSCALVTPTPAVGADESRGRCGGSPGRRWPEGKGKRGGKGKTERRRLKTKKKERKKVWGLIVKGRSGEVSRSELTSPRPSRWPGWRSFYRREGARKNPKNEPNLLTLIFSKPLDQ